MRLAVEAVVLEDCFGMAYPSKEEELQNANCSGQFANFHFAIFNYLPSPLSEVLHVVKQDLFAFLESHFNLSGRPGEFD